MVNYLNKKSLEQLRVADQVLVTLDGQEALNLLATHCQQATADCPTLLFLDVKMPVLDSFGFLVAYQQLPLAQQRTSAIVRRTTSLQLLDVQRLEQLPTVGFLNKPLTQHKVEATLKQYFSG